MCFRLHAISLLAVFSCVVLPLGGCSHLTNIFVVNRNAFAIEAQMDATVFAGQRAAHVPANSSLKLTRIYRPATCAIRLFRVNQEKGAPPFATHRINENESREANLYFLVSNNSVRVSAYNPQLKETALYTIGILGCIITVIRLYKQRKTKLR